MINIIAALDEKRGIGKNGKIPWHISEDFKRFKQITMGHPIIMGRKTFESIGRVLLGRTNIIVTQNSKFKIQNCLIANSLEEALRLAQGKPGNGEIFIIGGGQIFRQALEKNLVGKLYLTIVKGDYKADTFFPDYSNFRIVSEEKGPPGEYKYKFVNLVK